ncbi:hypothetical protein HA402_007932 [Bradysia odoriphaga]|nr:hypothetical protein HA402_007932 [Bradysia odoriphaga]
MGKIELGYWNIHGLASPIRFLLEVAGVDYDDKLYPIADQESWVNKKDSLGFTYPNLPYIIDGDVKMSEHLPIMRYISRKFGLAPTTEDEIIISDQTESFIFDIRFRFYMVAYEPAEFFDDKKAEWLAVAYKKLAYLNNLLGKNEYVTGSRLTYVDVYLYDSLLLLRAFESELITKNANLARFIETMNKHPKIAAYVASDRFKKATFCAPFATWNAEM